MDTPFSRREILTRGLPAMAVAGTGLGTIHAFAQNQNQNQGGDAIARAYKETVGKLMMQAHQNGEYKLPPLPYPNDALEPHIDAKTMQLHHDKHHQGYVNGLNQALKTMKELSGNADIDMAKLSGVQRDISFNGGGHALHTLFWATMGPRAGGQPKDAIGNALNSAFGSFNSFQNYFTKVASGVKGSGWAILAYEPIGDNLAVFQVNEHDTKLIAGAQPLLPIDVWEHAYYLKYQNARADYIKAWWNVVNWEAVNNAYQWLRTQYGNGVERDGRRS